MAAVSRNERKLRNAERRQDQIAACNMGNRTSWQIFRTHPYLIMHTAYCKEKTIRLTTTLR